ncbi:hypothetical protein PISMIDRAFT_353250 [Pisolithus microcarpus 441]|uniref:Uncharacterized protein n=1 Tax=Pisolithus microcarpus 441 TaxID=765257 RepID=A0A0C9ZSC3_9AGAM|nr:hypothetical protein PISMIDRAFT_353250 [Pisolithus microcarpus 441]
MGIMNQIVSSIIQGGAVPFHSSIYQTKPTISYHLTPMQPMETRRSSNMANRRFLVVLYSSTCRVRAVGIFPDNLFWPVHLRVQPCLLGNTHD